MGYARKVGWVTAGLVIGAGACYCIYRLARGRKQNKEKMAESGSADVDDAGDCSGARYNDWSDDDDDSNESKNTALSFERINPASSEDVEAANKNLRELSEVR
ncbi:hypothetical protein A6R68_10718 [Neotoma lepida]|uniref:Armadillo repeat-containing domain-containing protein n=1 Tax=Neotoma lepida TaxID=56216 RepID=A0A1A6FYD8_NEOLE|nr:hypothetical protein A6R68_10718 [Neotoma lepida]